MTDGMYPRLDPLFRQYVDTLVDHARTALWPERRAAMDSFRRGIEGCPEEDLKAAADRLLEDRPAEVEPAEVLFRAIVTAYLERLGTLDGNGQEVTNPDQARLYGLSLDRGHLVRAAEWLDAHPEYRALDES